MSDSSLTRFVEAALHAGASRDATAQALAEAGWSREQISDAMRNFAEVDFPVPVPRPRPQLSARDAFTYLLMFSMLYITAYQLGSLLFQFINLGFPDPLSGRSSPDEERFIGDRIRWASASLIVAFPVFLLVSRSIATRIAGDPALRSSAIRRWLTYLTLFVAACIIVGDLIVALYSLLSGELTIRFVLKALTIGSIAGGLFTYYLWSIRADDKALEQ